MTRVPGPDQDRLAERPARAEPARLGQDRREPEEAGAVRPDDAAVLRGLFDRAADRRADDPPVVLGDERRECRVVEAFLVLRDGVVEGGHRRAREDRRQRLMLRQRESSRPSITMSRRSARRIVKPGGTGNASSGPGASRMAWTCCWPNPTRNQASTSAGSVAGTIA